MVRRIVPCCALAVLWACSGPSNGVPSLRADATIASTGGTLSLSGHATVEVPKGALATSLDVVIHTAEAPLTLPTKSASQVVALLPHGRHFSTPARISLNYRSSLPSSQLRVLRLADEQSTRWEVVGGVKFDGQVATFESMTFSFYAVVEGFGCDALPVVTPPPACGDAEAWVSNTQSCTALSKLTLCENGNFIVLNGEVPKLDVTDDEQKTDAVSAEALAQALDAHCKVTHQTVSQAETGVLDACTDAPLFAAGQTVLVAGGSFTQRVSGYLERAASNVVASVDASNGNYVFKSRAGTQLASFPEASLTDAHDYFILQILREPSRGALFVTVEGIGWQGTPAAVVYFRDVFLPALATGQRTFSEYVMVEWTDNGDGVKTANDSFRVLAADLP